MIFSLIVMMKMNQMMNSNNVLYRILKSVVFKKLMNLNKNYLKKILIEFNLKTTYFFLHITKKLYN